MSFMTSFQHTVEVLGGIFRALTSWQPKNPDLLGRHRYQACRA